MNLKSKKNIATLGITGALVFGASGVTVTDQMINPYTDKGTTLEIARVSELPEAGEVKDIVSKNEPKVTFSKWNGEVALGVRSLDVPNNAKANRPLLSKNIEWGKTNPVVGVFGAVNDIYMEAIPLEATTTLEDGGMEINLILNSKPTSNVFTFQLENWENLDFFYQAPLWQEVGLKAPTQDCTDTDCVGQDGGHRPENVVGSYAVYYKDHANHKVGSTNYATGKAYHIFRPLVIDNNGNEVWADMNIDNGVLTVTVPQSFLDNASYPVKVDPTFGYSGTCASTASLVSQIAGVNYSAPENGTVTKISAYLTSDATKKLLAGLYTGARGSSHSLVSPQSSELVGPTNGWNDFTISVSVTNQNYLIAIYGDSRNVITLNFDSGGGATDEFSASTWTYPTWNDPSGTLTASANRRCIYATYTASGSVTPPSVDIEGQVDLQSQLNI